MIWKIGAYLNYLRNCFHLHGIHSPFVFELNEKVFKEKIPFYSFDEIESLRAKLLLTDKEIEVIDLGAGSRNNNKQHRKIKDIAKTALKKPTSAQLLFRLAYYFKPKTILELGTSFGITTSYLAKACPNSKVVTMEGSASVAKIAAVNLKKMSVLNVKQVIGNFDDCLGNELNDLGAIDFAYFDGNHTKSATLRYFNQCLNNSTEESVFVFDDIYWSREMAEAWKEIKQDERVSISIDLFEFGIVFLKKSQAKENFAVYH